MRGSKVVAQAVVVELPPLTPTDDGSRLAVVELQVDVRSDERVIGE